MLFISHLTTFFLQSLKVGSPSAQMFTIIKQSHLLLTRYLNHLIELILMEKNSITIAAINSWNNTQHQFSNLSLKTYSPTKIKSLIFKKCIGKY